MQRHVKRRQERRFSAMKLNLIAGKSTFIPIEFDTVTEGERVIARISSPFEIDGISFIRISSMAGNFKFTVVRDVNIDISAAFTTPGVVVIDLVQTLNGEIVRTWKIEPIVVKELGGKPVPVPAIENFRQELNTIKAAVLETLKLIKNIQGE